jgi:hypothetical protein
MAKKSNIAMIAIPVVLAAAGLYFILRKKKVVDKPKIDDPKPDKIVVSGKEEPIYFPLRRGSKGDLVKQLQDALLQYNPSLQKVFAAGYGTFGVNTEKELFSVHKKKMVETQAELDSIIRGGQSIANNKKSKVVGVYSPTPIDPFSMTKNI